MVASSAEIWNAQEEPEQGEDGDYFQTTCGWPAMTGSSRTPWLSRIFEGFWWTCVFMGTANGQHSCIWRSYGKQALDLLLSCCILVSFGIFD